MTRYRTIVADPPWQYGRFNSFSSGTSTTSAAALRGDGVLGGDPKPLPYATLPVGAIAALPISGMAARSAHLYLWTTQKYLWDAPSVARAWGFTPSCVLTWCKPPMGTALGFAFAPTSEFVLFAHRGSLRPTARHESTWFAASRPYVRNGGPTHSAKPDAFLDIVEQVSPGPYLELFARRQRLGWDTWGDEALQHVRLESAR